MNKAVVLLSGGLDSAVTLFYARSKGHDCRALVFDYGQRHRNEVESAKALAEASGVKAEVVTLYFPWKGSSLVDKNATIPFGRSPEDIATGGIPSTYVPARNTVFLSVAASFAETIGASRIFIGAHSEDSSGYPDCRRDYLEAFEKVLALGTKGGLEKGLKLEYPLAGRSKKEIVELGAKLKVPFHLTQSCYNGGERPCGKCDSCVLRAKGFKEAGMKDPLTEN